MLLAGVLHERLEKFDPLTDPLKFLRRDLVMRRVAGVDIGLSEQFETALGELGIARPDLNEIEQKRLGLTAQEVQPM